VKRFLPFPEVLDAMEKKLAAATPSFHHSALEDVTQILSEGRHYCWVAIYLAVAAESPQPLLEAKGDPTAPPASARRCRILLSMKLGSREIGMLEVESDRPEGFSPAEIVFLERVAETLARYLAGRGKFLARRAREAARGMR
jgi:GAF domain-containing protein